MRGAGFPKIQRMDFVNKKNNSDLIKDFDDNRDYSDSDLKCRRQVVEKWKGSEHPAGLLRSLCLAQNSLLGSNFFGQHSLPRKKCCL